MSEATPKPNDIQALLQKHLATEEPALNIEDAWRVARLAVEMLWELKEKNSEKFRRLAVMEELIPVNLPVDKRGRDDILEDLKRNKVITKKMGRPPETDLPLYREVVRAHEKILSIQCLWAMGEYFKWKKGRSKNRMEADISGLAEIVDLPKFSPKTVDRWKPVLMNEFLFFHDGKPELVEKLREGVLGRLEEDYGKEPKSYVVRNAIKTDFKTKIITFAQKTAEKWVKIM